MENAWSTVVPIRQADAQMTKSVDKKNIIQLSSKLLKGYLQKNNRRALGANATANVRCC
jgi:hypothetical protein